LETSYELAKAQFSVVLTNQSDRTINLRVDSKQFHGRIVVTAPGRQPIEYLDAAFIPRITTSVWEPPTQKLRPHGQITWILRASQLCDIHRNPLDTNSLHGASITAKLDELAVIPSSGNFISDNAKQVSQPVRACPEREGQDL
jgi:hypothetical protein